jgi:hypothetical protein
MTPDRYDLSRYTRDLKVMNNPANPMPDRVQAGIQALHYDAHLMVLIANSPDVIPTKNCALHARTISHGSAGQWLRDNWV